MSSPASPIPIPLLKPTTVPKYEYRACQCGHEVVPRFVQRRAGDGHGAADGDPVGGGGVHRRGRGGDVLRPRGVLLVHGRVRRAGHAVLGWRRKKGEIDFYKNIFK